MSLNILIVEGNIPEDSEIFIRAAGASASENLKNLVLKELKKSKIKLNAIIDKTRPTTNKNTVISNGYKLIKIDKNTDKIAINS